MAAVKQMAGVRGQDSGGVVVVESVGVGGWVGPPPAIQVLVPIVSGERVLFHQIAERSKIFLCESPWNERVGLPASS
jgi:hypothetical protein